MQMLLMTVVRAFLLDEVKIVARWQLFDFQRYPNPFESGLKWRRGNVHVYG